MSDQTEPYRIGVTGAAGYIGARVVTELKSAGYEIIAVDNFYDAKIKDFDNVTVKTIDIRDRNSLRRVFSDVDVIAHLAGLTGVEECENHPETAFDVNVGGTENIVWLCREWEIPLIFPLSMAVIGDPVDFPITSEHPRKPLNHYGLTKTMSEQDIRTLAAGSFPAHIFMKSNLYGHHTVRDKRVGKQAVINLFVKKALNHDQLTVHKPGTQARDFIHVKDVARCYLLSVEELLTDESSGATTFPVAGGDCLSILEIAELVQSIMVEEHGYKPDISLIENPRGPETTTEDFTVDTSAAKEKIGFTPNHTVEETIRKMIRDEQSA